MPSAASRPKCPTVQERSLENVHRSRRVSWRSEGGGACVSSLMWFLINLTLTSVFCFEGHVCRTCSHAPCVSRRDWRRTYLPQDYLIIYYGNAALCPSPHRHGPLLRLSGGARVRASSVYRCPLRVTNNDNVGRRSFGRRLPDLTVDLTE